MKVLNFNRDGLVMLNFLMAAQSPSQNESKASAIDSAAKDLIYVKTAPTLGHLAIKRFIWELLTVWSLKLKLKGVANQFDNLSSVYQDSPQLSHMYDEIFIKQQTS